MIRHWHGIHFGSSEHDFLIYGKYNAEKLQDIVMTINTLQNRTLSIERLLTGQDLHTLQVAHMVPRCHQQDDIHSQIEPVCT